MFTNFATEPLYRPSKHPEMDYDEEKIEEAVLASPRTNAFVERSGESEVLRAWKGLPWEVTDRLHERGLIDDPKSNAKSVVLTDEGKRVTEKAFQRLFVFISIGG